MNGTKEVIIDSRKFDLGLDRLEKECDSLRRCGVTMELEVAGKVFVFNISRKERGIVILQTGQTLFTNIRWRKFTRIGLRRPIKKTVTCFSYD